jgi:hypothetical protein
MVAAGEIAERRVRMLTDWCRRDPDVGAAQLQREEPAVREAVQARLAAGPKFAPSVWAELHRMRMERQRKLNPEKPPKGRR